MSSKSAKPKTRDPRPKTHPASVYVKDAEGIGKAWGMEFYSQRKQRLAQLEAIRNAMAAADFPEKIKGKGYDRAAVVQWGMAKVEMHESGRKFRVNDEVRRMNDEVKAGAGKTSNVQRPTSNAELPEQPDNGQSGSDDLFAGMSPTEMRKGRFDRLQDMYLRPEAYETKIAKFEIDELRQERPYLFARETAAEATGLNITGGVRGVANWIRQNFPGLNPSHTDIHDWIKGERLEFLPVPCQEFFPAGEATGSGRFKTAEVRAWVDKYLAPRGAAQGGLPLPLLDDRRRREKADADMAEMAADAERKRTSGLYVLTTTAQRTGTAIGIALRTLTREALEREVVKRFEGRLASGVWGLEPKQVAALKELLLADCVAVFTDWQRRSTVRLEELMVLPDGQ